MSLLGTLGLDKVEGDPNNLPDGKYRGVVSRSEYVEKKDGTLSHVITYKVTDPSSPRKGAEKAEWFNLGKDVVRDDSPAKKITGFTPTMSEAAKPWYKKRFLDLGIPEDRINEIDVADLVGVEVDFGVKTKDGFSNINFAQKASGNTAAATPQNVDDLL